MLYIGADLGTSSLKLLLVNDKGEILNSVTRDYPLIFPRPGWCEQDANEWWNAFVPAVKSLLDGHDLDEVKAIGLGGQMHGLVILDDKDELIRPVILWNDGRTDEETEYLNNVIGKDRLAEYTGNIAFAGFTAPKLLWMKEHEPENFSRISKIMLPKDYINYLLTGVHSCDYSDASGLLLLDVKNRCWSREMLEICSVREDQLPKLFESYEVTGTIKKEVAELLGLPCDVKVIAGAGDNAAAAVGTGTVGDGACNISLGTSGTIFTSSSKFAIDPMNSLHAFAHADGTYHLMGVLLSAASCNKWFCEEILGTDDFNHEQEGMEETLGKNNIFFLPYLMGERSPINDTYARSLFIGMSMDTSRRDMVQAVLEGVGLCVRDCVEVSRKIGVDIKRSKLCGGGAKSPVWRKIIANVLAIPIDIPVTEQGPGYGAAMLCMVGTGLYKDVKDCADALIHVKETVYPDPELVAAYDRMYEKHKLLYPALKDFYEVMNR